MTMPTDRWMISQLTILPAELIVAFTSTVSSSTMGVEPFRSGFMDSQNFWKIGRATRRTNGTNISVLVWGTVTSLSYASEIDDMGSGSLESAGPERVFGVP